jgi:hypothetical protein
MRVDRSPLPILVICSLLAASLQAKERKKSDFVRDGSTQERAIVVTEPEDKYVHWEYAYLAKHFPGRTFPMYHGLVTDEPHMRAWDVHHFTVNGQQKEFWFDITQQFREFSRKHPEIK